MRLAAAMNVRFPNVANPPPLSALLPSASPAAIKLMQDLLIFDPKQRPSAAQALTYAYFQVSQSMIFCSLMSS
jgi:serine/threonine protein kinase